MCVLLSQTTSSFLMCASNVAFSLVVVCSITPAMIFAIIPVGLIYNRVQVRAPAIFWFNFMLHNAGTYRKLWGLFQCMLWPHQR